MRETTKMIIASIIAMTAEIITERNFSVTLITPLRYSPSITAAVTKVATNAVGATVGNLVAANNEIPPIVA